MRPHAERPAPNQQFAFDRLDGQLVVYQNSLIGIHPNVEVYEGPSMAACYVDTKGEEKVRNLTPGHYNSFHAGDRLLNVQVGNRPGEARQPIGGNVVQQHTIILGDQLIVDQFDQRGDFVDMVVANASAPLPTPKQGTARYDVRGIMTSSGQLITWGMSARQEREAVDLAIANRLVSTTEEFLALEDRVRPASLLGTLSCAQVATVYLQRFDVWFDTNFTPNCDLPARRDEFVHLPTDGRPPIAHTWLPIQE